jgi:hypothetical protein
MHRIPSNRGVGTGAGGAASAGKVGLRLDASVTDTSNGELVTKVYVTRNRVGLTDFLAECY